MWLLEEPLHAVVTVAVPSLVAAVVSVTPWLLHRLDELVCKTQREWGTVGIWHDNLLMKIALTMPSATAGRMGAMAVMAGTVVVTAGPTTAGVDITPVPVPPVTAAAPPVAPDTTVPPAWDVFL